MSEQLSLPGFEPSRKPSPQNDNLFLAFVPPATKLPLIGELARQFRKDHGLRGKLFAPSCFHVSLHSLGAHHGLPPKLIDVMSAAMSGVCVPPFDVSFDRAPSFYNKRGTRPFVLRATDVAALNAFHRALGEAIIKAGLGRWVNWHFTPHMTLLYDRCLVEEHEIETLSWSSSSCTVLWGRDGTSISRAGRCEVKFPRQFA